MGNEAGSSERFCGTLVLAACGSRGKLRILGHTSSGFTIDQPGELCVRLKEIMLDKCPIGSLPYTN
jgi:hypothetical protein